MNYLIYRENNNFDDLLKDATIKKCFKQVIRWRCFVLLMSYSVPEEARSYIMIKYGDDIKTWDHVRKDNSPVPYVDYSPDNKRPEKFKNVYK